MSCVDMRTLAACFDLPENMVITAVHSTALTLTIDLASADPTACCPLCRQPSERVHSRYSHEQLRQLLPHARILSICEDRERERCWNRVGEREP